MTLLWIDDFASEAIGFDPPAGNPINGTNDATFEVLDGSGAANFDCHTDVQFAADGVTHGIRSRCEPWSPNNTTQRAEFVPTNSSWSGQGFIGWRGWDITFPRWASSGSSFGPLIAQWRRSGNGNGPISLEYESSNNRLYLLGASGYGPSGRAVTLPASMGGGAATSSVVNVAALPAPGDTLRIVIGVMLHDSNGWVEVWTGLNGAAVTQVGSRIQPWIGNNTAGNGPINSVSSTTDVNSGSNLNLKNGTYRGSTASGITAIFSSMAHGTTKADVETSGGGGVVGKAPSGGIPTNPTFATSLSSTSTTMTMPAKPVGMVEGDIILCGVYLEREVAITMPSRPAGYAWTSLDTPLDDTPSTARTQVFYTREDLAGTDWTGQTITWDGVSATHSAMMVIVRDGILYGNPLDAAMTSNQGTGTTVTYTGLTTATAQALLVAYQQNIANVDPTTQPTGFANIVFGSAGSSSELTQVAAGATGSPTQTLASAPTSWHAHLLAIRPEPQLIADAAFSPSGGTVGLPTFFDASASVGTLSRVVWASTPSGALARDDSIQTGVTGVNSTDTITKTAHGYADGDRIRVWDKTGGSSITEGGHYYIRDSAANTYKLASTSGGSAVDLGSDITTMTTLRVSYAYSWSSAGSKSGTLTIYDAFGAEAQDTWALTTTPTDSTAPVTTILTPGPGDQFSNTSVPVTWSRNETNCTSEVKVDGGAYTTVGTATSYTGVYAIGAHTVQVRSTDSSGNIEGTNNGPSGVPETPPIASFTVIPAPVPSGTEYWGVLA